MKQISESALLELIERYFDCALSDDEEAALRRTIAHTAVRHPAVDEARAVMGLRRRRRRRFNVRVAAGVAAAVAAFVCLAVAYVHYDAAQSANVCVAYAYGTRITDEEAVRRLISDNLSEFTESSESTTGDFRSDYADFADIVNVNQSKI